MRLDLAPAFVSKREVSHVCASHLGTGKVAAYGIGGLIAGKLLSKAGSFAIALAFLKKGWVRIAMALAGLLGAVRRLFLSKSS